MKRVLLPVVLAAVLLVTALGSVAAVPNAAPVRVINVNSVPVATDTTFRTLDWAGYQYADIFYRVDVNAGAVNTTTLELEVSPDGSNWYDHNDVPAIVSNVAADANGYTDSVQVEGYKFRIIANVTNTNTVTPNIKMVLR
jgi:hypothetical protein